MVTTACGRLDTVTPTAAPGTLRVTSVTQQQVSTSNVVSGCAGAVGVVCDQTSSSGGGSVLAYTGSGLLYQGVALLVLPGSQQLVLPSSSNTSCGGGSNGTLSFPLAPSGGHSRVRMLVTCTALV